MAPQCVRLTSARLIGRHPRGTVWPKALKGSQQLVALRGNIDRFLQAAGRRNRLDKGVRRLRFEGGALIDAEGNSFVLRGMSLFWSQWMPQFFNADVVRWLVKDWRINVIRAPMAVARPGYLSDPRGELDKVGAVIEASIANNIHVIVDWHAHHPETEAAATFFGSIVERFGDVPNILYETWNEPGPGYAWEADIKPHHRRLANLIRTGAPNAPLIAGTPDFCRSVDVAADAPLQEENVAYGLHFYAASHGEGLRRRVDEALKRGAAVFASEWGAGDATGDGVVDLQEATRWLRFLEQRRIGHLNWSICDKAEACAALLPGADPRGGWGDHHLTPSGRFVRAQLRRAG